MGVLQLLLLAFAVSVPMCWADVPPNPVAPPQPQANKTDKSAKKPAPKPSPKPSIKPTPKPGGASTTGNGGANSAQTPAASTSAKPGAADVDFGPYMADLQRRIKRAWFPPKGMETKVVTAVFKVHQQGELSDLKLHKSSGVAIADQAALKAVENAAPFRPLPEGSPENIDIQFTFDYNVFNGRGGGTFQPAGK